LEKLLFRNVPPTPPQESQPAQNWKIFLEKNAKKRMSRQPELCCFGFLGGRGGRGFYRQESQTPPKNPKHPKLDKHFWKNWQIQKHDARFLARFCEILGGCGGSNFGVLYRILQFLLITPVFLLKFWVSPGALWSRVSFIFASLLEHYVSGCAPVFFLRLGPVCVCGSPYFFSTFWIKNTSFFSCF
jgi:hypothetical protein